MPPRTNKSQLRPNSETHHYSLRETSARRAKNSSAVIIRLKNIHRKKRAPAPVLAPVPSPVDIPFIPELKHTSHAEDTMSIGDNGFFVHVPRDDAFATKALLEHREREIERLTSELEKRDQEAADMRQKMADLTEDLEKKTEKVHSMARTLDNAKSLLSEYLKCKPAFLDFKTMFEIRPKQPYHNTVLLRAYNLYHALDLNFDELDKKYTDKHELDKFLISHILHRIRACHPDAVANATGDINTEVSGRMDILAYLKRIKPILCDRFFRERYDDLLKTRTYVSHGGFYNTDVDALMRYVEGKTVSYTPKMLYITQQAAEMFA